MIRAPPVGAVSPLLRAGLAVDRVWMSTDVVVAVEGQAAWKLCICNGWAEPNRGLKGTPEMVREPRPARGRATANRVDGDAPLGPCRTSRRRRPAPSAESWLTSARDRGCAEGTETSASTNCPASTRRTSTPRATGRPPWHLWTEW